MSLKKFFEQHLQIHTLRIELNTGRVLVYQVDSHRKEELEEWMRNFMDPFSSLVSPFLSFYSDYDRMTFVRIAAVTRIIFLWDAAEIYLNAATYSDPFNIVERSVHEEDIDEEIESGAVPKWLEDLDADESKSETTERDPLAGNEWENAPPPDIPDAIVLTADAEPFLYFDLDAEVDYLQVVNESGLNSLSIDGRFISFADGDGEQNYIPVENVICLDVARKLVFNDVLWQEMELKRSIDNNSN